MAQSRSRLLRTGELSGHPPQNYVYIVAYNADGTIDTQSNNGIFLHITVPRQGNVFVQVGRFVLDGDSNLIFQVGPDQDFTGDNAEFCAVFGSEGPTASG